MRPPQSGRGQVLVETEVFKNVRHAIQSGQFPILLLGAPGSGKTTLLRTMYEEWIQSGRRAVYIPLREVSRNEDLYLFLRRELTDEYAPAPVGETNVIASSGRATLRSTVEIIRSLDFEPLLLFDGLDEMSDPSGVLQLIGLLSRPSAKLVVASRDSQDTSRSGRLFRSIFQMSEFTAAEAYDFIQKSIGGAFDKSAIERITQATGRSPISLFLLAKNWPYGGEPLDTALLSSDKSIRSLIETELASVGVENREDYLRALTSLAVLGRDVPASEYPARRILELQSSGRLTRYDGSSLGFVHPLVAEAVLSFAGLTGDSKDLPFATLEFGAEEAERDGLLSDGFIALPEFSEVLAGKKNIVIGDRGAGKSAMFARLSASSTNGPTVVQTITYPADLLRKLEANGSELSTADQFRAGWLTLVAYCIARQVKRFSSHDNARAAVYLKEILGDEPRPGRLLRRFLKDITERILKSSVKIKLGPVMIEPAGEPGPSGRGSSSIDLRAFLKDGARSLAACGQIALVPLDRVDEVHKYDRDLQQKAIQGLFLAEGDLAQLPEIRLVIFLRSDLFRIYDIQEKNKLVSRSITISWTKPELLRFLVDRVLSNRCLHRLKELITSIPEDARDVALTAILPMEIEGLPAAEWLWEWMENGNGDVSPRQLILLLILATQSPMAQARLDRLPILPSGALQWGMDQLSELSFKELVDDFRVAPTFLANCRAGRVSSFELAKVESLFGKDEGSISVQVERLERLGFLERIVVQATEGKQSSEFRVPKLFTRSWSIG